MKLTTIVLLLGLICAPGMSQDQPDRDELVWYGMDYSLVRLVGERTDFSDLEKIRGYYFRAWNELMIIEREKYDLKKAFGVKSVTYDIEKAISRSEKVDLELLWQNAWYSFDVDQAIEVMKNYIAPGVNKVGGIFVVETLNQHDTKATMWLLFFNVSTGELIHMGKYEGIAGGFGFRNYWVRPYYDVLTQFKQNKHKPF